MLLALLALLVLRTPLGVLSALEGLHDAPSRDASEDPSADRGPAGLAGPTGPEQLDGPGAGGGPVASVRAAPPAGSGDAGSDAGGDAGRGTSDVPEGRWGAPPARPATTALLLEELRGGWRVEPGVEEAAALAVLAAHAWADAHEVRAGAEPTGRTGAIVTVEAVERPGAHHAVVTLLVVREDGPHRIAVPVLMGAGGPRLAGGPWSLPAPHTGRVDLRGTPTGDADLLAAARRALEEVGIPGERLAALEVTEGWPFIARLDDDSVGHPWLRWHLDRFVVAGLPLNAGGREGHRASPEGGGR